MDPSKRNIICQPSVFRVYVSFREGIGGIGAFAVWFCFPLECWFSGLVFAFKPHHLEVCWGGIKSASRLASVCLKSAMELDFCYMPFFKTTHELLISKHLFETRCCFPAIFVAIPTLLATYILVAKAKDCQDWADRALPFSVVGW